MKPIPKISTALSVKNGKAGLSPGLSVMRTKRLQPIFVAALATDNHELMRRRRHTPTVTHE
jgi:hypothetical protein